MGEPDDINEIAGRAVRAVVLAVERSESGFAVDAFLHKDVLGYDLVACGARSCQTLVQILVSHVHLCLKIALADHETVLVNRQLTRDVNGLAHLQYLRECFLRRLGPFDVSTSLSSSNAELISIRCTGKSTPIKVLVATWSP